MKKQYPKNQEQARQYAQDWQYHQTRHVISYQELAEWAIIFEDLAQEFDLSEEFTENGII